MRTDLRLQGRSEGKADANRDALRSLARRTREGREGGASLSGNERNHLFVNDAGAGFVDISSVSGLDSPADGRAFATLDFDRDGWIDVALVNANDPRLSLFRNRAGCEPGQRDRGRMLALRLEGGNRTPLANPSWSNRDGVGAVVEVRAGGRRLVRERRAGEGLAAQNSSTLLVGLGTSRIADSVSVRWPSGRVSTAHAVAAGTLLTVHEDPGDASSEDGFSATAYRRRPTGPAADSQGSQAAQRFPIEAPGTSRASLRLYTTLATWCVACRTELPALRRIRERFAPHELAMFGVPSDPGESAAAVEAWASAARPPYRLLSEIGREDKAVLRDLVIDRLGMEAVPAAFVTDADGRILSVQWGVPSVSAIRALLAAAAPPGAGAGHCPDH